MGALRYCESLAGRIEAQQLIASESAGERAIWAATILAGEYLTTQLGCTATELDSFLWLNRKEAAGHFHLTSTTAH